MKPMSFVKAAALLKSAVVPEDVFGDDVECAYRALAMDLHI